MVTHLPRVAGMHATPLPLRTRRPPRLPSYVRSVTSFPEGCRFHISVPSCTQNLRAFLRRLPGHGRMIQDSIRDAPDPKREYSEFRQEHCRIRPDHPGVPRCHDRVMPSHAHLVSLSPISPCSSPTGFRLCLLLAANRVRSEKLRDSAVRGGLLRNPHG